MNHLRAALLRGRLQLAAHIADRWRHRRRRPPLAFAHRLQINNLHLEADP